MKFNFLGNLFLLTFVLMALNMNGQDNDIPHNWKEDIYYGMNFSMGYSQSQFLIEVAPEVGYYITRQILVGTGPIYAYHSKDYFYAGNIPYYNYKAHFFGGKGFARYYFNSNSITVLNNLLAHAEYEYLNINASFEDYQQATLENHYEINSFFIGGGYRQSIGKRLNLYLLILWDLNNDLNSPYNNPVIRFGIGR